MYRVLIVDDEMPALRFVRSIIEQFAKGFQVTCTATSGEQGLEYLQQHNVELLITDISMHGMNGIELARAARALQPNIHIVIISGYGEFEYAQGAIQVGVDDYLLKPFRDQELTHAVARVCRRMQPVSAAPAPKEKEPEATGYVRQAMDYIAAHYADADISIAVIAEHLRVSEGHLSHVFKKQTGMTVTNYLTKTRIDAAMRMLARDHVKVYEAAAAVGYKDVTYFSATFKKLTGLSPSEVE